MVPFTLVGTYRKECKPWILSNRLYNYPVIEKAGAPAFDPKRVFDIFLYNRNAKLLHFGVDAYKKVGIGELRELGYHVSSHPRAEKYWLFTLRDSSAATRDETVIDYTNPIFIRLDDCANNDADRAVLTHWLHNIGTPAEKPYEKRAVELLSPGLVRLLKNGRRLEVCEGDACQMYFPGVFDVPFPPPKNPRFTFIDLFAGIGGFRLAMQACGGKCVFSSEWDKPAQETYFANYGEVPFGDITLKQTKSLIPRNFDVLCAGFPCQPFSISGKMKGFHDTRGTLFFDVCKIIETHQPEVVFLENVKHLIHHDHGRTLHVILERLKELGYTPSWRLLNASDFGVAQNRERIIIIATKGSVFNFDVIKKSKPVYINKILDKDGDFEYLKPMEYTLIDEPRKQESGLIFVGYRNKAIRKAGVRPGTENLSRVHKQPNRIYSACGIHPTLPSQETSGRFFILTEEDRVRRLTISECYKLMGFPASFIVSKVATDSYRQVGNSVCVPMIKSVIENVIKEHLV